MSVGWGPDGFSVLPVLLGVSLIGAGLALVVWTVSLFVRGRGTLAPGTRRRGSSCAGPTGSSATR